MTPRPGRNDEAVRIYAAELCLEALMRERLTTADDVKTEANRADIIKNLMRAMTDNGYEFAKNLENYGWFNPDAQLVELLDADFLHEAHRQAEMDWVKAWNVKPSVRVGDYVSFRLATEPHKERRGTVLTIDEKVAKATVHCPADNHNPQQGWVLEQERLSGVPFDSFGEVLSSRDDV